MGDLSHNSIQPHCWPESVRKAGQVQRFFFGFWLVGLDLRVSRRLRKDHSRRPSCLALWPNDSATLGVLARVSKLLMLELDWPNDHFHPEDQMSVLLHSDWVPGDDDLEFSRSICREFGVEWDEGFWDMTLRQFIDRLKELEGASNGRAVG